MIQEKRKRGRPPGSSSRPNVNLDSLVLTESEELSAGMGEFEMPESFGNGIGEKLSLEHYHAKAAELIDKYSSLERYLYEIGRYRLLKHREEIELARAAEENLDINARNALVVHNLRLVVSIAKRYLGRGIHLADLVQEGNVGLIAAADKYDYKLGYRFTTYATWWIRQGITRSIQNDVSDIHIPVNVVEMIPKVMKISATIVQRVGRDPSAEEIAEASGIPIDSVKRVLRAVLLQKPLRLDHSLIEEDDNAEIYRIIPDTGAYRADSLVMGEDELFHKCAALRKFLTHLFAFPDRNREVFFVWYGLTGDFESRTLETIGERFGVTRQRVCQIIDHIWIKLPELGVWEDRTWLEQQIESIKHLCEVFELDMKKVFTTLCLPQTPQV